MKSSGRRLRANALQSGDCYEGITASESVATPFVTVKHPFVTVGNPFVTVGDPFVTVGLATSRRGASASEVPRQGTQASRW